MQEQVATRKQTKPSEPTYKMKLEKDVDIPMRDGARLKADVFRPEGDGQFSRADQHGHLPEGQALGAAGRPGGEAQSLHELGDRQSGMVGAARLLLRARRRARLRQVTGAVRAVFAAGGDRLLRRDRMGRPPALEQRPRRHHRHLVLRPHAVVGGQSQAAVAHMHRAVGGRRRSVPRHPLSRRHFRLRLHRQLVYHPHGASHARPRLREQSRHLSGQRAVAVHAQQPRQRHVQEPAGAMGQDRSADVGGRQLVRHGTAPARRHRGLCARRIEEQEAAHPLRHALPSVLQRGRPARPAPLLRLLAQGHRQRRDAGAAGQARHPHRPWRIPFPPRERVADRAHAVDQIASRSVEARRRRGEGHRRHLGENKTCDRREPHLSRHHRVTRRARFGQRRPGSRWSRRH